MKIQQNDLVSDMLQSLLKKLLLQKCVTDVQHDVLDQKSNDLTVRAAMKMGLGAWGVKELIRC